MSNTQSPSDQLSGRERFLGQLREALESRGVEGIEDIINDYRTHIDEAQARGQDEFDVIRRLGTPRALADAYDARQIVNSPNATLARVTRAGVRLLAIAPLQLLFGFIPLVIAASVLITTGSIGIGTFASGLGIWAGAPLVAAADLGALGWTGFLSLSAALLSLGVFFVAGTWLMARGLVRFLARYISWNLDWALERRGSSARTLAKDEGV